MQAISIRSNVESDSDRHVGVLDGWRGLSILLVLAAHLLPLSPKSWQFNESIGIAGMALFFILSGFLITSSLIKNQDVPRFLVHRFCRVVPLAWLYIFVALGISNVSIDVWVSHILFYANLPSVKLIPLTAHIWSLCVEVQFYVGVAILVVVLGVNGLLLLPFFALLFTALRIWFGVNASSITYFRIDEILAGCTLALLYHGRLSPKLKEFILSVPVTIVIPLFLISCLPQGQWFNFLRPYLAALLIGVTITNNGKYLSAIIGHRVLIYCAKISYSLYVIHPLLADSWLGSGDINTKYLKRSLLFVVLFVLAHLSTNYFEKYFNALGRRLSAK
jgi:peptidoglycan/LPS O-acetylase OafA/YrhL